MSLSKARDRRLTLLSTLLSFRIIGTWEQWEVDSLQLAAFASLSLQPK